jgi:hypothetical protein
MWTRTRSAQSACVAAKAHHPRGDYGSPDKALASITGVNFGRLIREGFSNFNLVAALEKMGAAEAPGAERNVINYPRVIAPQSFASR